MRDLLVDGQNLAVRIWKGMPELNTSKGQPIHVVFGVLKNIRMAIELFKADRVIVAWDGSPVYRRAIFSGYKQKRRQAKEEYSELEELSYQNFKLQVEQLKQMLPSFGVIQLFQEETEADDLISLSTRSDNYSIILSEDKDFIQLVSKNVTLYRPISQILYNPGTLWAHAHFHTTQQYLNYRVLSGDTSDEIPGVPGFGAGGSGLGKRASELIWQYNDVNTILNHKELNKGKIMGNLFSPEGRQIIIRNFMLMDLSLSDSYMSQPWPNCVIPAEFDIDLLKKNLIKYEFISLVRSLKEFARWFEPLSGSSVL